MEEIFQTIQNDSTLMFVAGIAAVVLLIIVLVVVIFSTKAKTLSERLAESLEVDRVKSIKIEALEKELQDARITNASQAQELQHFTQVKEDLASKIERIGTLQTENGTLEKELSQTQTKLENLEEMHENLVEEHKLLQERFEQLQEDNHKYQVNNARLLMKLEAENRYTSSKLEMMQEHKKELKTEFERLAKQIFEGNSEKFAEFSKQNIDSMIKPLQTQIEEFKKQVSETYNTESQDRAVLKNEMKSFKELNEKIS
jgi:DNA recombination protein RmuC